MRAASAGLLIGLSLAGAAQAEYVPAHDPLMQLAGLKQSCLDRIRHHLGRPDTLELLRYGNYLLPYHDYVGSPERKWIPIRVSVAESDGHRVQLDWVCSFRIEAGHPAAIAAFVQ
jgi:hypothetical protein